jgi:small subunit ribosomal protein S24e
MDILVVSKKENLLLGRTEVQFKISHPKEKSPERDLVREKLAAILNEKKDGVIIDSMRAEFGKTETRGYAKVYKTKEAAMKIERDRTLCRNKLKERKATVAKEKAPKPEAAKGGAPPAKAPEKK